MQLRGKTFTPSHIILWQFRGNQSVNKYNNLSLCTFYYNSGELKGNGSCTEFLACLVTIKAEGGKRIYNANIKILVY